VQSHTHFSKEVFVSISEGSFDKFYEVREEIGEGSFGKVYLV
jgi:hypothetical protein